uniref:Uncharacterized protein n=1 Tax=Physcomitrium patens TaxID=3218 RepID=A0A2K1JZ64_PHYPA|nr:hypothetical protein PHYPA_013935 [Physcomitrium patens]
MEWVGDGGVGQGTHNPRKNPHHHPHGNRRKEQAFGQVTIKNVHLIGIGTVHNAQRIVELVPPQLSVQRHWQLDGVKLHHLAHFNVLSKPWKLCQTICEAALSALGILWNV